MIVVCTRCQAKFRVADEKVGPRGAKVRCSRCQNVFLVHRDLGSMPLEPDAPPRAGPGAGPPPRPAPVEIDLEPGGPRTGRAAPVPPPADPFGAVPDFLASPVAGDDAPPSVEDPFLAAAGGPTAPSRAAPSPDPFASAMAAPRAAPDPFSASGPFAGLEAPVQAPPGRPDPFAAPPAFTPAPAETPPRPEPASPALALPVTDLSDLMAGHEVPRPDGETSDPDFALESKPAAPKPRISALEAAAEAVEANMAARSAERHETEFYSEAGSGSIGLANEPSPAASRAAPSEAPTPVGGTRAATPVPAAPRSRIRAPAGSEAEAELAARTLAQRLPRLRRASRLRKTAFNALALVALVIVSLALLVLLRSGGRIEPGALRPSAVLRALGGQPLGSFAAVEVTSGAYERAKGPPLLFVRGRAVSRVGRPVRALRVSVEVVRRGEVVAHGGALAGAVLTPEELHGVSDAAQLAALTRNAEARAPRVVNPDDAVPFLVAIADYPGDLSSATLRLAVTEEQPGAGR